MNAVKFNLSLSVSTFSSYLSISLQIVFVSNFLSVCLSAFLCVSMSSSILVCFLPLSSKAIVWWENNKFRIKTLAGWLTGWLAFCVCLYFRLSIFFSPNCVCPFLCLSVFLCVCLFFYPSSRPLSTLFLETRYTSIWTGFSNEHSNWFIGCLFHWFRICKLGNVIQITSNFPTGFLLAMKLHACGVVYVHRLAMIIHELLSLRYSNQWTGFWVPWLQSQTDQNPIGKMNHNEKLLFLPTCYILVLNHQR